MNSKIIPIFPLHLVLFPHQELPLRIFEPRYKQLIDDCMLGDKQFGVCLVDENTKLLGWDAPMSVGTIAKIRKCQDIDLTGIQLYIETIGHNRFQIIKLIPPSISLPYDYDPLSPEGLQKIANLHEKLGTHKKFYIQAEVEPLPDISENLSQNNWENLVSLWKQKIITQALPKIVNSLELDNLLLQYGLVTDIPTVDYVYSLASLGASSPHDLQPILEANTISILLQKVEELLKRK